MFLRSHWQVPPKQSIARRYIDDGERDKRSTPSSRRNVSRRFACLLRLTDSRESPTSPDVAEMVVRVLLSCCMLSTHRAMSSHILCLLSRRKAGDDCTLSRPTCNVPVVDSASCWRWQSSLPSLSPSFVDRPLLTIPEYAVFLRKNLICLCVQINCKVTKPYQNVLWATGLIPAQGLRRGST